jgi:hypothetical protein
LKPKHLFAVPVLLWAAIAAAFVLDGARAMENFAALWALNDLAIAVLLVAVLLHVLKGPPSPGPSPDEWAGWNPQKPFEKQGDEAGRP